MKNFFLLLFLTSSAFCATAQDLDLPLTSENYEYVLNEDSEISKIKLLQHLQFLSSDSLQGRKTGEPGNLIARNYIVEQFQKYGLDLYKQDFSFKRKREEFNGMNIIATITGTEHPERYIAVTAHYDHVGIDKPVAGDSIYNGADDNASGTVALLEMAAYFTENPPRNSILLLALDAEEMGLQGAHYFVATKGDKNIVLNVNMDMISRNPESTLNITGTRFTPSLKNYFTSILSASLPITITMGHDGDDGKDSWVKSSDHFPFYNAGIPFLYFGVEDHPGYHQPSDEFENIHPEFYFQAVKFITNTVADLDRKIK